MNHTVTSDSMQRQQILQHLLFDNNSIANLKQQPVSEINILELSNESMSSNLFSTMSNSFSQDEQNYHKLKKLSQIMQIYSKRVYQNIIHAEKQKLIHKKSNLNEISSNYKTIQTTKKQNQNVVDEFISAKNNYKRELVFDKLVKFEEAPTNSKILWNVKKQKDIKNKQKQSDISIWSILLFIFVIVYCAFLIF